MVLEGGALLTDEFAKFTKDYVAFCHITTEIQGEKYGNLLEEKGGQGFPYIVFMDSEGKVLAVHEDERTADGFSKTGEKVRAYVGLKAKFDAAKTALVLVQLELGHLKLAEAEAQLKDAKLTPEQQATLDGERLSAMVLETLNTIESDDDAKAAGKKFYEMQKAGKPGPTSAAAFQPYYVLGMNGAAEAKDVAVFEKNLAILKDKFGSNPLSKDFFEAREKKLAELKGDK